MHATIVVNLPYIASKIIASTILLFRNATTENQSVNWTIVNCPGWGQEAMSNPHLGCGDARGRGHEIDKCITF